MSSLGTASRGAGLRIAAGGALLTVSLVTVLVRSQVVAERYALADCARREADAQRHVAANLCSFQSALQDLSTTGQQATALREALY